MKLLNISASGIKGQEFDLALGDGGTAIIGDNATGKTAIVEAIKFVLRGKFSEVKKRSWPELTATGKFDTGKTKGSIERTINAKGTVNTIATVDLNPDDFDVPLLDPEHYFSLTDSERVNYVFSRVKLPDSYTPESILAQLERVSLGEEHTEHVEKAKAEVIVAIRGILGDGTLQESLEKVVQALRTQFTYWNKRQKETQGAVTTLTELKNREKTIAAPGDLEKEIAGVQAKIDECNSERGGLFEQRNTADTARKTKNQYQRWLDEDRTDHDTIIRQLREKKLTVAADFERAADSIMGIDFPDLKRELGDATIENRKASEAAAVFESAIADFEKALEDLEKQTECPYCHSDVKDWKKAARAGLKEKLTKARQTCEAQDGIAMGSRARILDLEKRIASFTEINTKREALRQELKKLGDDLDTALANQKKDDKRRAEWTAELGKIVVPKNEAAIAEQITTIDVNRNTLITEMATLRNRQRDETKLRQDLTRAAEAEQEHRIAAAQLLVTKTIAKEIEKKREAMICEVFGKLLGTANMFVKGILKAPLILHENTIGMFVGSKFVEHYWFSGTEKALGYIAIATALSVDSSFKMPILDEFGRLDTKKQVRVIERLEELVKRGVIDQYVIAGTSIPTGMATPELLVHVVK